jgi:hypothetical protein
MQERAEPLESAFLSASCLRTLREYVFQTQHHSFKL